MEWKDYPINKISKSEKEYPQKLHDLKKSPELIYYRGNLKNNLTKTLGVVGSRRMTSYGRQALEKILPNIIDQGVTIISGFMYGVDTLAHSLSVSKSTPTIAVLGNGLNQCYPTENSELYTKILKNKGAIISEYDPEIKSKPYMFVQRNRIIAALSTIGILVVEASEGSGSLVTTKFAQELGRSIYAIPGPVTSSVSFGTNSLIKSGTAKLVMSSNDILKNSSKEKANDAYDLNKMQISILKLLKNEVLTMDEISIKTGVSVSEIGSELTMMSFKGIIIERAGKFHLL